MDNAASLQATNLTQLLSVRNNQIRELADKNSQWEVYSSQLRDSHEKVIAENKAMKDQLADLKKLLEEKDRRLAESELSRLSLEQDMQNFRRSYDTEIDLLRTQANIYEEDFNSIRRELESTKSELSTVKLELHVAQNTASRVQSASQMTMDDIHRRREESLARYRQQYELRNPNCQIQQRGVYQTDSYNITSSDGEDEID